MFIVFSNLPSFFLPREAEALLDYCPSNLAIPLKIVKIVLPIRGDLIVWWQIAHLPM